MSAKYIRLGKRQMALLDWLKGTNVDGSIAGYSGHLPRTLLHKFDTERQWERFLEDQEADGLIRIENRRFLRITEKGAAALTPTPTKSAERD